MDKPIINLWQLDGIGLVISHPTGILYSNQTGGYACLSPKLEGAFIPLKNPVINQQEKLYQHFTGSKWKGHCYENIDIETADFIDGILDLSYLSNRLKVNREKLNCSHEAWIHVVISPNDRDEDLNEYSGFTSNIGVITWENSD